MFLPRQFLLTLSIIIFIIDQSQASTITSKPTEISGNGSTTLIFNDNTSHNRTKRTLGRLPLPFFDGLKKKYSRIGQKYFPNILPGQELGAYPEPSYPGKKDREEYEELEAYESGGNAVIATDYPTYPIYRHHRYQRHHRYHRPGNGIIFRPDWGLVRYPIRKNYVRPLVEPIYLSTEKPRPTTHTTKKPQNHHTNNKPAEIKKPAETKVEHSCGITEGNFLQLRIIGGRDANPKEFPWQMGLESDTRGIFCGATIINKRWAVTAAHCVVKMSPLSSFKGVIGTNDLTSNSKITVNFKKLVSHKHYRSDTIENDIALLETMSDMPIRPKRDTVNAICLPAENKNFEGVATVSGWGRVREGGRESDTLKAAEIELMSDQECENFFKTRFKKGKQLCAGLTSGEKDSCQGDSGGPLITYENDRAYLIGIVSYGRGCGRKDSPGVYTKVSHYIDWIKKNMV